MSKRNLIAAILLLSSLLTISTPLFAAGNRIPRDASNAKLAAIWVKLDTARAYREDWRGLKKTYSQVIDDYTSLVPGYSEDITPQELFLEAADDFRTVIGNPANAVEQEEATWGLQESLNEYMAGQLLLGNDYLIKGLRVRFPGNNDPEDPDQLTLLTESERRFYKGINGIVEDLRRDPETMRSRGNLIANFPIFVENSYEEGQTQGQMVENELYRFTNLVERRAMASNSKGKRMFFFGNVNDIDNFPYGNFPGKEDLDFNGDGVINEGGRGEAAVQFKKSAHSTYLHTAVLAAVQSTTDFDTNNGYQLKRQIKDAQVVFDDILDGLNPLDLLGDFIPYQPVENFLNLAKSRVQDAIIAENAAAAAERTYDTDMTALSQTLQSQQESYLDRIQQMTGLNTDAYDLLTREGRNQLLADAEIQVAEGKGELGIQQLTIEETVISAQRTNEMLQQIPKKIQIENERNGTIARIVSSASRSMSALSMAEALANSVTVSVGFEGGASVNTVSVNPLAAVSGMIRGQKDLLQAMQQIEIGNTNSAATIKQLLLEQTLHYLSVKSAQKVVEREKSRLDEMWAQLQRVIRNYTASREDMAEYYFMNPAYRLDRDQLAEAAETSFETAMTECYYAAKALEYLWSEKYNNPVPRMGGGFPESLSASFDPYVRAESVFAVQFAGVKVPNLNDFLSALQAWDLKMRQFRGPMTQTGTVQFSMRSDILGFDTNDADHDKIMFKHFIDEHRTKGLNPDNDDLIFEFTLELGDEQLFPAYPNLKIREMRVNLVSDASRSIIGGSISSPALVDLIMLDEAHMRTFFAAYPTDDDILTYSLESGRTLEKSPFIATIEATIDGYSNPEATPNIQLADHSPACTRWVFRMKMNRGQNRELLLNHLEDIEIRIGYQYGKPRNVGF